MKQRCTYTIEESVAEKLERAKKQTKRSKSSIVQEAIQKWLKQHEHRQT